MNTDPPTRVEDWRVPDGHIGITVDVAGSPPTSLALEAGALVDLMERCNPVCQPIGYESVSRMISSEFPKVRGGVDDETCKTFGIMALWVSLYHPMHGHLMRSRVSDYLRDTGKAHISWRVGPSGLAMSLGDKFADLGDALDEYAAAGGGPIAVDLGEGNARVMQ
jgi:hypothetical protein